MSDVYPVTGVTISQVLLNARRLLMDPAKGPRVTPPGVNLSDQLVDVRLVGRGKDPLTGEPVGTEGWLMGSQGAPFAQLGAANKKSSYAETSRVWEDYDAWLKIGLSTQALVDGTADLYDWSGRWEAVLQQWFPLNYRIGDTTATLGDIWWLYLTSEIGKLWSTNRITTYGLWVKLQIHLVRTITWNPGSPYLPALP